MLQALAFPPPGAPPRRQPPGRAALPAGNLRRTDSRRYLPRHRVRVHGVRGQRRGLRSYDLGSPSSAVATLNSYTY